MGDYLKNLIDDLESNTNESLKNLINDFNNKTVLYSSHIISQNDIDIFIQNFSKNVTVNYTIDIGPYMGHSYFRKLTIHITNKENEENGK